MVDRDAIAELRDLIPTGLPRMEVAVGVVWFEDADPYTGEPSQVKFADSDSSGARLIAAALNALPSLLEVAQENDILKAEAAESEAWESKIIDILTAERNASRAVLARVKELTDEWESTNPKHQSTRDLLTSLRERLGGDQWWSW